MEDEQLIDPGRPLGNPEHTRDQEKHRRRKTVRAQDESPKRRPAAARTEPAAFRRLTNGAPWELPPATAVESRFRHGHWTTRRDRIKAHLQKAGANTRQIDAWDACGGACTVEYSRSEQRYRLRANYCKNRHCEPCMRAKANRIAANLKTKLGCDQADAAQDAHRRGRKIPVNGRLITLTLKHSTAPLAQQIARLITSFKKLRSTPLWKRSQDGGAWVLEVKWTGSAWHPHLHAISTGRYLDKCELSDAWHHATGDSFIVDIRAIDSAGDVAEYVCKYVTKSVSPNVWANDDLAQEWICASRSVRACNTFGTWRRFALTKHVTQATDWEPITSLNELARKAAAGDEWANRVMLNLRPPGTANDVDAREAAPSG